jgi:hypothetical protein
MSLSLLRSMELISVARFFGLSTLRLGCCMGEILLKVIVPASNFFLKGSRYLFREFVNQFWIWSIIIFVNLSDMHTRLHRELILIVVVRVRVLEMLKEPFLEHIDWSFLEFVLIGILIELHLSLWLITLIELRLGTQWTVIIILTIEQILGQRVKALPRLLHQLLPLDHLLIEILKPGIDQTVFLTLSGCLTIFSYGPVLSYQSERKMFVSFECVQHSRISRYFKSKMRARDFRNWIWRNT